MLYATPAALNLTAGGSDTVLVTDQPMTGFSGAVNLSVSNLPAGVTASFNPASTAGTSILTLTAGANAAAGTSTVTLTGLSGSLTQTGRPHVDHRGGDAWDFAGQSLLLLQSGGHLLRRRRF